MFKRTEESKLTSWFFEIDRRLLYMVLLLMLIGWSITNSMSAQQHYVFNCRDYISTDNARAPPEFDIHHR